MAELVDLIIDRRVLLDIGIGTGDIRLRLVIIIIRDKILDRVLREKLLELGTELSSQRLVVGKYQRRLVDLRDDIGHCKGLTGTGNTQQGLFPVTGAQTGNQACYCSRLVPGRLIWGMQFKIHPVLPP